LAAVDILRRLGAVGLVASLFDDSTATTKRPNGRLEQRKAGAIGRIKPIAVLQHKALRASVLKAIELLSLADKDHI
jgi:hypothetical protein